MELNYVDAKSIRSSAVLTGSYVAATVITPQGLSTNIDPSENTKLVLLVDFTKGNLTSAELKIEFSDNGTDYYQETNSAISEEESTLRVNNYKMEATGKFIIETNITAKYIKVSVVGTGTVTSSLMAIKYVLATRPN